MICTHCPHCGSGNTQSRDMIYHSGTSTTLGRGGFSGISFGRRRGSSVWFGRSTRRNTRQTLLAQAAAPMSLYPPIPLVILAFWLSGSVLTCLLLAGWLALAIWTGRNFANKWLCKKCGARFVPNSTAASQSLTMVGGADWPAIRSGVPTTGSVKEVTPGDIGGGKSCSICGKWFRAAEFEYGNRTNRSYCCSCSKEETEAYARGGVNAARQFRSRKRATWEKS